MSKVVTYLCDCCVIVYPLDELEAVQVYVFSPWNDPKMVDYEMVCPNCREELENLIKQWLGGKPNRTHHVTTATETKEKDKPQPQPKKSRKTDTPLDYPGNKPSSN